MQFRATPESVVILLLTALAAVVLHTLMKRKLESNLPLIFYVGVMVFMAYTGRGVNAPLVLCGLAATLVLRFEFMNRLLTNVVWAVAVASLVGIVVQLVGEAFGVRVY
jgi:hypothetical protein